MDASCLLHSPVAIDRLLIFDFMVERVSCSTPDQVRKMKEGGGE